MGVDISGKNPIIQLIKDIYNDLFHSLENVVGSKFGRLKIFSYICKK